MLRLPFYSVPFPGNIESSLASPLFSTCPKININQGSLVDGRECSHQNLARYPCDLHPASVMLRSLLLSLSWPFCFAAVMAEGAQKFLKANKFLEALSLSLPSGELIMLSSLTRIQGAHEPMRKSLNRDLKQPKGQPASKTFGHTRLRRGQRWRTFVGYNFLGVVVLTTEGERFCHAFRRYQRESGARVIKIIQRIGRPAPRASCGA